MSNKNNRRVIMTKRLLREALIELLEEKEISQITVRELCEIADINRSTFYLHYNNQYELLEEMENDVVVKTLDVFKDVNIDVISYKIIEVFLNHIYEHKDLFSLLFCKSEAVNFRERLITTIISQLSKSLSFSIDEDLLQYIYSYLLAGCSAIIIDWIRNDFNKSSTDIAKLIFALCDNSRKVKIK